MKTVYIGDIHGLTIWEKNSKRKNMMYIVKYSAGEWDDYYQVNIFVTADKEMAEKYVEKFNNILKKWKDYFSQFKDDYGFSIKDEYLEHSDRYYDITKINTCYYDEIELR